MDALYVPCSKHHLLLLVPDEPGKPRPPFGVLADRLCPACQHEREQEHSTGLVAVEQREPQSTPETRKIDRLHEEYKTKLRAQGWVEPGSPEETDALDEIDSMRPEVIWRDHNPRARKRRGYKSPAFRSDQSYA